MFLGKHSKLTTNHWSPCSEPNISILIVISPGYNLSHPHQSYLNGNKNYQWSILLQVMTVFYF